MTCIVHIPKKRPKVLFFRRGVMRKYLNSTLFAVGDSRNRTAFSILKRPQFMPSDVFYHTPESSSFAHNIVHLVSPLANLLLPRRRLERYWSGPGAGS